MEYVITGIYGKVKNILVFSKLKYDIVVNNIYDIVVIYLED